MQAWNPTIETNRCGQLNMGKTGQSIGMVLCFVLAIISQMYSNEINDIFKFDVSGPVDASAPLVGLQTNESWFIVLVDFQSNQLNNDDKEPIESEFQDEQITVLANRSDSASLSTMWTLLEAGLMVFRKL